MTFWIVLILKMLGAFFGVGAAAYAAHPSIITFVLSGLSGVVVYLMKSPLS